MADRQPFPLVPRWRLTGLPFGEQPSVRRGPGSDVAGSRAYVPGDPVSSIDWYATARLSAARGREEFVVREHFEDEAPRVVVVSRPPAVDEPLRRLAPVALEAGGGRGGRRCDRRQHARRPRRGRLPRRGRRRGAPRRAVLAAAARRSLPVGDHGTRCRRHVGLAVGTRSSARLRTCTACAPPCRRGASSSSSRTSSSRCPSRRSCVRPRCAGTSCRSSFRTRCGSRASRCCRPWSCRSRTPPPAARWRRGCAAARCASGRRPTRRGCAGCWTTSPGSGSSPSLVGSSDPRDVDRAFLEWAERRRRSRRRRR